mmetsp:Transcript_52259/g.59725  ORF Transcript_52259/g.59725 Transcript_52259/m.59725 type:complete len:604 (+) Transcript_52259:83-1894(+)
MSTNVEGDTPGEPVRSRVRSKSIGGETPAGTELSTDISKSGGGQKLGESGLISPNGTDKMFQFPTLSTRTEPHLFNETSGHFMTQGNEQEDEEFKNKFDKVMKISSLASFRKYVHFRISSQEIFDIFESLAKKKSYHVIEINHKFATIICRESGGLLSNLKSLMKCAPLASAQKEKTPVTAMKLMVTVDQAKCMRVIQFKGLYGCNETVRLFYRDFEAKLQELDGGAAETSIRHMTSMAGETSGTGGYGAVGVSPDEEEVPEEEEEEQVSYTNSESSSYYQFHKILSSEQYSLGYKISDFLVNFSMYYRSIEESAQVLPQPLNSIKSMIEESVDTLFHEHNYGKGSSEKMMQFCRPAVERFIFSKLYDILFAMYKFKYEEKDSQFDIKCQKINQYDPVLIMKSLEIKKKYIIHTDLNESMNISLEMSRTLSGSIEIESYRNALSNRLNSSTFISRVDKIPYYEAIQALQKVTDIIIPKDKLACLVSTVAAMKTCVVDFWKGKEELLEFDDEIGVMIYIVAQAQVPHLFSELELLRDYIGDQSMSTKYENEVRIITNLEAAGSYITREWEIEKAIEKINEEDSNRSRSASESDKKESPKKEDEN